MFQRLRPLALVALLILVLTGCNVNDEINDLFTLPEETQTGEHTFGCRVDGDIWLPYTEHTLDRAIEADFDSTYFSVRVERETGKMLYIYFSIADSAGIREKTYTTADGFRAILTRRTDSLQSEQLQTDDSLGMTGYVTITKVKQPTGKVMEPGILAGTFSFKARSPTTGLVVNVTEGRFDFSVR